MAKIIPDGGAPWLTNEHPACAARMKGIKIYLDTEREGFVFITRPTESGYGEEFFAWCPTCRGEMWYQPNQEFPADLKDCCRAVWGV